MASANSATATKAAAAASSHSSRRSAADGNSKSQAVGSPRSRRTMKTVSSPWTQIVSGESDVTIVATPSSPSAPVNEQTVASASSSSSSLMAEEEGSETGNGPGGNAVKRPAWNKPSNGDVESGPVMGAASWPALSESARASTKSSSDIPKGLSDGSSTSSCPQGTGIASSSSEKLVSNSSNPSSTPNHTLSARQRSMKRNGANTSSNSGAPQSLGSQGRVGEVHLNNSSPRDNSQRNAQPRGANDHPQQRNSFRNRNGGPHSRGDGSHHHNPGGRRDQDRTNADWNNHRYFNGRDNHMQSQRVVPRFMRHPPPPPPTSTPFMAPSPVRHFGSPMGFPELAPSVYYIAAPPPDSFRGLPFVTAPIPPHPMLFPVPDLQLHSKLLSQIDYYFSNENLIRDIFLRQNMDDQGWVPVQLIATFNKVSNLTNNIQIILDAVRNSIIVEVQGDRLRRRNDWMKWILPPAQFPNMLSPQSNDDMLLPHVQSLSLEEKAANHGNVKGLHDVPTEALPSSSSSRDMNSHSDLSSNVGVGPSKC